MTVYLTLEEINALLDAPSLTDEERFKRFGEL